MADPILMDNYTSIVLSNGLLLNCLPKDGKIIYLGEVKSMNHYLSEGLINDLNKIKKNKEND